MTDVLDIVAGDAEPLIVYIQDDGVAKDISNYSIELRVKTSSTTQVVPLTILDPLIGKCSMDLSGLPAGVWKAAIKVNSFTTTQFTISVEQSF